MDAWMQLAGLGLSLAGAIILALTDAWLTRSMLVYLDAVEANVEQLVESLRAGSTYVTVTSMDVRRDRRQNQVRSLKMVGWLALAAGFALQFAKLYQGQFLA